MIQSTIYKLDSKGNDVAVGTIGVQGGKFVLDPVNSGALHLIVSNPIFVDGQRVVSENPVEFVSGLSAHYKSAYLRATEATFVGDKGGPTSGNFGHGGRPGQRGGSSPKEEDGPEAGKRGDVFGHPAAAVVRWMGANGYNAEEARRVLDHFSIIGITRGIIVDHLDRGKNGHGKSAPITEEQAKEIAGITGRSRSVGPVITTPAPVVVTPTPTPVPPTGTASHYFIALSPDYFIALGKEHAEKLTAEMDRLKEERAKAYAEADAERKRITKESSDFEAIACRPGIPTGPDGKPLSDEEMVVYRQMEKETRAMYWEKVKEANKKCWELSGGSSVGIGAAIRSLFSGGDGKQVMSTGGYPKQREVFARGAEFYKSLVGSAGLPTVKISDKTPDRRCGGQMSRDGTMYLRKSGYSLTAGVVVHELGHHLEHNHPDIENAAHALLERRTAGQREEKIRGMSGTTIPDKFITSYMGRQYMHSGKRYASEICSVGIEHLYKDPHGFAKKDPETFAFILGVLKHIEGKVKP